MSDDTRRSETESIEDELRALRVRDPRPDLRERVIGAPGQAPALPERRLDAGWGLEMALAAAIVLVIVLTGLVNSRSSRSPAPAVAAAEVDPVARETCRLLGRTPQDWECRRLAIAARAPASSIGGIAVDTLEDAMSLVRPRPELRSALKKRLSERRRADPIRRGLEGEVAWQTGVFEDLVAGRVEPGATGLPYVMDVLAPRFYLRLNQAASLRATTALIQRADRTTADLNRTNESEGPKIPFWAVITRIALPSLNRALYSRDELRARLDLGRLALAAEESRSAHGSYPSGSPESWSTSDRVDPITGAPYSYQPKPDGFSLSGQPGRSPALTFVVTTTAAAPQ